MIRQLALFGLLCAAAGCSDIFALPLANNGDGSIGGGGDMDTSMSGDDLAGGGGSGGGDGGSMINLPAACARLSCTPAMNEGNVQLDDTSGTVSGCHAYDHLTITNTVRATQFLACAQTIMIGGTLDANGGGSAAGMGTGAGAACTPAGTGASGGSHGGAGADPGGCGGGATVYGDLMHPREPGSGGGGTGAGSGGGVIELAAGTLNLLSLIRANGENAGGGVSAGGGGGGSVLIDIDDGFGAGRIEAVGGAGFGIKGGGGGGGRVAVYTKGAPVSFQVVIDGGASSIGPAGASGSVIK
ncbi:MAG: hypothetical protein ACXVDD_06725 [Polyangia bacterium]